MVSHTFAICAYKDSPYLEACIKSLKRQSVTSEIILCTSTPSRYLQALADVFDLPLYVRDGESDIQADWNFAYGKAKTRLVTIAHQDDCYHRDYGKQVQACWERYPDTTVFTTDCVIIKHETAQKPDLVQFVKHVLRFPLRFHGISDRTWVKRLALRFGNPIICPSCTYDKEALGEPLFDSPYKFALDWDTMWKLAERPGRFVCIEKPLLRYRIHDGATTKACIENHQRTADEAAMFARIWPEPIVRGLMFFYRKAYGAYDS
ncbi:MAG: glycosyltransferase family A protein [Lachnospiraceae bacterium]|nr:glycosyltransferase family A protein [Lachnospiraceae bacterium]